MKNKLHVLIPCAGSGSRFGSKLPKQYHQLLDKTVLDWTLEVFTQKNIFASINIVYAVNDKHIANYFSKYPQVTFIPLGGTSRAESVNNGLSAIYANDNDWVLVHDAARCCLNRVDLENLIDQTLSRETGGILVQTISDTVKIVNLEDNTILRTIDRNSTFLAQTPQMFKFYDLKTALSMVDKLVVTDEASAMELAGFKVQTIISQYPNFKITVEQDLKLAEFLLQK